MSRTWTGHQAGGAGRGRRRLAASIGLCTLLAANAVAASTCETLRTQIENRIAASGVARFRVTVVEAEAPAPGQVVGSCDMGRRKIVYLPEPASTPPAQERGAAPIITECRDGSVRTGGDCNR